jgi:aspartyl protease family protein
MRYFVVFAGLALAIFGMLSRFADKISHPGTAPMMASAVSAPAAAHGPRSVTIPRDSRGHFQVNAQVDGRRVAFMVDTGASTIALTTNEARRLGIHPVQNDFSVTVRTANGTVKAAPVRLNMVDIGGLVVRDVQAIVAPDDVLSENLLGLSYLTKLKRFEYANGKLVLEQ